MIIKNNKKAQGMKSKISPASPFGKKAQKSYRLLSRKSGQEEMVGFALIIILVSIILIVLLAVYIKKPSHSENIKNPEVNSFVQSFLQYTTLCEQNSENITIQSLISKCQKKETCSNNIDTCKVLNDTLNSLVKESWNVGPENPVKGYNLIISVSEKQFLNLTDGVVTNNYKTGLQDFSTPDGKYTLILFNAYS